MRAPKPNLDMLLDGSGGTGKSIPLVEWIREEHMIRCTCECKILLVDSSIDLEDKKLKEHEFYLTMYQMSKKPISFFERCWQAMRLIWLGDLHADTLILSREEAEKLGSWLKDKIEEANKYPKV